MRRLRRSLVRPRAQAAPAASMLALARSGPAQLAACDASSADALKIAAVIPSFLRGSGGHRTIVRLLLQMRSMGHDVSVWLQDNEGWHAHESVAETKRRFAACFDAAELPFHRDLEGWAGADVVLATGWQTVPGVMTLPEVGARAYLVQDHEPDFYPASAEAIWAAQTYRTGLHCIAASSWLAKLLRERYGACATHFDLGVDHSVYAPAGEHRRDDLVIFYARAATPRRAVPLGLTALSELAARRPSLQIESFGETPARQSRGDGPSHSQLGVLDEASLASLYSRAAVGMVFSLTNPSLIGLEMMACGLPCIELASESMTSCFGSDGPLQLVEPDPLKLCAAIERLLDDPQARARLSSEGLELGGHVQLAAGRQTGRGGGAGGSGDAAAKDRRLAVSVELRSQAAQSARPAGVGRLRGWLGRAPRALVLILAVAALQSVAWNLALPAFQGPDEDAHFAYVQRLAETGQLPSASGGQSPVSIQEHDALTYLNLFPLRGVLGARPAWSTADLALWRQLERTMPLGSRANGSGPNAVGQNPPLYYALMSIPYRIFSGLPLLKMIFVLRLFNALLYLATIALTWTIAGDLFGKVRWKQTLAAGAVALEPQLAFMSAVINADNLLIALTTAFLLAALRFVMRGPTLQRAFVMSLLAAAAALTHGRGLVTLPVLAVALVAGWVAHRPGRAEAARQLAASAGTLGTAGLLYFLFGTPAGAGSAYGGQVAQLNGGGVFSVRGFLEYVWRFYFPRLPGMGARLGPAFGFRQVFIETFYGAFGWLEVRFKPRIYDVLESGIRRGPDVAGCDIRGAPSDAAKLMAAGSGDAVAADRDGRLSALRLLSCVGRRRRRRSADRGALSAADRLAFRPGNRLHDRLVAAQARRVCGRRGACGGRAAVLHRHRDNGGALLWLIVGAR